MKELTKSSREHLLKNLRDVHGKAPAFLATSGKSPQANGMTLVCVASRGRLTDGVNKQHIEVCPVEGKTNCLTTVTKDNLIMETELNMEPSLKQLNPSTESGGRKPYQQNRVYDTDYKPPSHCARPAGTPRILEENGEPLAGRIRRLTPTECARLQTIPEWYKWQCSNAQQYKMLGNGWTVEVIKHIFSFIDADKAKTDEQVKQAIESGLY